MINDYKLIVVDIIDRKCKYSTITYRRYGDGHSFLDIYGADVSVQADKGKSIVFKLPWHIYGVEDVLWFLKGRKSKELTYSPAQAFVDICQISTNISFHLCYRENGIDIDSYIAIGDDYSVNLPREVYKLSVPAMPNGNILVKMDGLIGWWCEERTDLNEEK